jgi:peptidoglycan/xylan/chitin deacetylase (PgdA/CDA1 family)
LPDSAQIVRRLAYAILGSRLATARRLRAIERAGVTTILMFHRVGEPDGSAYRPLSARLLDELLGWAARHFSIVSFAELAAPARRPKMILTFDDGYRDFVDVAMPILARHGLRATQNVIPRCVDTGLPPLNVLAADFLGKAPPERVRALELPRFDFRDPRRLWPRLDDFLKLRPRAEQEEMAAVLLPQFFAWEDFQPTPMMDANAVREAARVHEIGCHSFDHASMAFESDDYLRQDILRCRRWYEETLGGDMRIYTFPNGSHRAEQPGIAHAAGAEHILLVGGDFGRGAGPLWPRFGVEGVSRSELRFRALGALRPVRP